MKPFHLLIIGLAIGIITTVIFTEYQNLLVQQELKSSRADITRLNSTLNNYVNLFGNMPDNYTLTTFPLNLKVFVASSTQTDPVNSIKTNQPYQVITQVTRQNNQPLIYYYCIVQVQDEKGTAIVFGWSQQTMIPKQYSSQCAVRWIPNDVGNYTIHAFAWQDLDGTPRAEPAIEHIHVLK